MHQILGVRYSTRGYRRFEYPRYPRTRDPRAARVYRLQTAMAAWLVNLPVKLPLKRCFLLFSREPFDNITRVEITVPFAKYLQYSFQLNSIPLSKHRFHSSQVKLLLHEIRISRCS